MNRPRFEIVGPLNINTKADPVMVWFLDMYATDKRGAYVEQITSGTLAHCKRTLRNLRRSATRRTKRLNALKGKG